MDPQVVASWILVVGYAAAIVVLVVRGARRNESVADYAVGNLAFSPVAVGLALAASTTSAATFIINPGLVAYFGLSAVVGLCVVLPVSMGVSLVVLTKGFRKYGGSVKALTLSQWVGTRYGSRPFAVFFAVLSLLLVTFIVMILVGLTKVVAASLGLDEIAVLAVVVAFSFGYMMFGGANSMVYTNTVQAVIMIVVAVILLGSGGEFLAQGFGGLVGAAARHRPPPRHPLQPGEPVLPRRLRGDRLHRRGRRRHRLPAAHHHQVAAAQGGARRQPLPGGGDRRPGALLPGGRSPASGRA